ncbi:interleukin-31 receptor subunit alpha isoform X1 [Bufo bufo]|uniref:interleukin-31 receptor subunit alpha isoform X1 n=2 Tax=Bufo bufo TaxID=8384 RepID=UPI001ABE8D5F|nr:interleukin-31 receptor subunit alpha isoform X1 [Bufo bufo]
MEKAPGWMVFCRSPWFLLLAAAQISGTDGTIQGSISPQVKYVLKGSDVSFYCILKTTGVIKKVQWELEKDLAAVYDIVNDTTIKVTIPNLLADTARVACSIYIPKRQQLDEINIISGYPPEVPKNISCMYFHTQNVTCSWTPVKDHKIPTTFNLTVLNDPEKKCLPDTNSCSFLVGHEFGREYNLQLQVENGLGKATRQFTVKAAEIVKMDPPDILSLEPLQDSSFLISWRRPALAPHELDVTCSMRYRELQDDEWDCTPHLYMEREKKMIYSLSGLHAFTEYAVSLRCTGSTGQTWWSEWSGELAGRTAEQAPLHSVELWRAISPTGRRRLVYLSWKERSGLRRPGITLGYDVQWFTEDRTSDSWNKTTKRHEMTLNMSEEAHVVSVVHFNSAGSSPKATLRIPAAGEKTGEATCSLQISTAAAEDVTVTWTVKNLHFQRFVLDWCIASGVGLSNISFQYVENSSTWTIEKGSLEPYKRYRISVYPVIEDRAAAPCTAHFYSMEGAPLYGPNVKVEKRKKTEVTIRWDPLRPEETNGFITAFSIVYRPLHGQESIVTVNSDVYEHSLRSLRPNTLYSAYVIVSTRAGNKSGNLIQFHTLADSTDYTGAVAGALGACLLLILVLGIAYKQKREKIKNLFWPNVPDPSNSSISEWPSDWVQTVQFLSPEQTDGALHSGDLHILHAVYVNDKTDRERLLPDLCGSTEVVPSMEESSIVMHYAMTEHCPEPADCTLLLHSPTWAAASLYGGQTAAAGETAPDLICNEDTAVVNPYLKNSVRTREHTQCCKE